MPCAILHDDFCRRTSDDLMTDGRDAALKFHADANTLLQRPRHARARYRDRFASLIFAPQENTRGRISFSY